MDQMTGLDARFLFSETPTVHMHTLKIAIVDPAGRRTPLTPQVFEGLLEERLDRMPVLRRRVVPIPHRLGRPVWIEDPDFDVANHVDWCGATAPGGLQELAEIVARIAGMPLDLGRPPWTVTVVEGLGGDRLAVVVKLHHALADGAAAAAMLQNAFVADPASAHVQPHQPEPVPSEKELLAVALRSRGRQMRAIPTVARAMASGLRAASASSRRAGGAPTTPFSGPRTSFNVSLTPERTFALTALPMADLLALKRTLGATLNGVFLGLCAGALRRYLARRDELPEKPLVAGVPVGTRRDEAHLSGNHLDNMYVPLPTDRADPVERLRSVQQAATTARTIRGAMGHELLERRAGLTPLNLYALVVRLWTRTRLSDHTRPPINLIASSVTGPRETLETDGGEITALYSVGPILDGVGLNITAWSYVDDLGVGILGCPNSLPDPWALATDLEAELADLRARIL